MSQTLTKSERLKILLKNGFFPSELPPPFNTRDLAVLRKAVAKDWPKTEPPKSIPAVFNHPRAGISRRRLSIVNPISQFKLSELISDNWVELRKFLDSSKTSLDRPVLTGGIERAIPKPDFAKIDLKKLEVTAEYNHILYSDISRFYGTIYTHAFPWALHEKEWSKANMHSAKFKGSLGNRLDIAVRKGQDNQTLGIPIGPDTSRILSELIAISVEREYEKLSGGNLDGVFRYVDDWFVGFDNATESDVAISFLSQACSKYELELNMEKTKRADSGEPSFSKWPDELLSVNVPAGGGKSQQRKLKHFFDLAFHLIMRLKFLAHLPWLKRPILCMRALC